MTVDDPIRRAVEEAWALYDLRRYDDAAATARRALASTPDDVELIDVLACALMDGDNPRDAIPIAERYLALAPDDPRGFAILGWALHRAGKHEAAVVALRDAVRGAPLEDGVRVMLADALVAWREWAVFSASPTKKEAMLLEAAEHAAEAVRLAPANAASHAAQAKVAECAGELPLAREAAERALALDANHPVVLQIMGRIAEKEGDLRAAGDLYVASARANPHSGNSLHHLRTLRGGAPFAGAVVFFAIRGALIGGRSFGGWAIVLALAVGATLVLVSGHVRRRRGRRALSPEALAVLRRDKELRRARPRGRR